MWKIPYMGDATLYVCQTIGLYELFHVNVIVMVTTISYVYPD